MSRKRISLDSEGGGSSVPSELSLYYAPHVDKDVNHADTLPRRRSSSAGFKSVVRRGSEIFETHWPFKSKPAKGDELCPIKDKDVQKAIVSLFQQKHLSTVEMTLLCDNVRDLSVSDLGPFIFDYYKNQLMTRGLRLLRDKVQKDSDLLLRSLCDIWDAFYKETLPLLQMVLRPIQVKDLSIRQVTLLGFRDTVLFKTDIEEALDLWQGEFPPAVKQMLLVLQSVHESGAPSESALRLERLVARVIKPYLGYLGLYMGKTEPAIRSSNYPTYIVMSSQGTSPDVYMRQQSRSPGSPDTPPLLRQTKSHQRHTSNASSVLEPLEPVLETAEIATNPRVRAVKQEIGRCHSFTGGLLN